MFRRACLTLGLLVSLPACDNVEEVPEVPLSASGEDGATPADGGGGATPGDGGAAQAQSGAGRVDAVEGKVTLHHGGAAQAATAGATIEVGDKIETGPKAKARLVLKDETVIALGAKTTLVLDTLESSDEDRRGAAKVLVGKFWAQIAKFAGTGTNVWEFSTPNAVAGVRGTTLWGDIKVDAICALEGEIEVRSLKAKAKKKKEPKAAKLTAGQCASKLSKGKTAMLKPTAKQVNKYLSEVLIDN